jgi:hypothetical protein
MAQARRLSHAFVALGFVAAAVSSAAWLEGCTASAPARGPAFTASHPTAPTAAVSAPAVSHDFGALVPAPFGTAFKDVAVPLTEVLVFHPSDAGRMNEDADCFRPNVVVAFLGRVPTDHLLCFDRDRLKRVEASVALPAAEAPALFAAACADWRRGNPPIALEPDACEGRQGDIAFSAHRADGPDSAAATVSITLVAVSP